ncbi:putative non-specific serine/threonine protein kinase [Helianthus anomalus]
MKERSSGLIIGISIGVEGATITIRANGADTCTILSDSSMGTESSRTSVQNGVPLWLGGLKMGYVVAASGILDYSYKYVQLQIIVMLLRRLHHRNLVNLVGYCAEKGQYMLIYRYTSTSAKAV